MEYINKAEELKNQKFDIEKLVSTVREYLVSHFENLGRSYKANSILESRFTPPEIVFNIGMNSCGSKTNIAAQMLRHIGFDVKKIHGSIPESLDHSWIKVKDPIDNVWKSFDITKPDCIVTNNHKVIAECQDWSEINDVIQEAFRNPK